MRARGDALFPALSTDSLIAEKESDLLVVVEGSQEGLDEVVLATIRDLEKALPLRVKALYRGFQSPDGIGHLGFKECTSNLQHFQRNDPKAYRRYVYVQNGEAGSAAYDGGTYVAFRKYRQHLDRWFDGRFSVQDPLGEVFQDEAAREYAVGRSMKDGLVIDRDTREHLGAQPDEAQGIRAFQAAHIRKANPRGRGTNNFGESVVLKDARILRRGFSFCEPEPGAGGPVSGLLFLCFQSNIDKSGFEFIHNEWLMSGFMGGPDSLLNPHSGVIEPLDGCYYFVPPVREFAGDIFFI